MASSIGPNHNNIPTTGNVSSENPVSSSSSGPKPNSSQEALRSMRASLRGTSSKQTILGAFGLGILGSWGSHVISRVTFQRETPAGGGGGVTRPPERNPSTTLNRTSEQPDAEPMPDADLSPMQSSRPLSEPPRRAASTEPLDAPVDALPRNLPSSTPVVDPPRSLPSSVPVGKSPTPPAVDFERPPAYAPWAAEEKDLPELDSAYLKEEQSDPLKDSKIDISKLQASERKQEVNIKSVGETISITDDVASSLLNVNLLRKS